MSTKAPGKQEKTDRVKKKTVEVTSVELVMPEDTNNHGTLFGGRLLEMMDKTAAIAAMKYCRKPVVTASFEAIDFIRPIFKGDIIELCGRVIFTGWSSLVVEVDVFSEAPTEEPLDRKPNTTGYVVMVSVDREGRPQEIPELILESKEQKALFEKGKNLKDQRIERARP